MGLPGEFAEILCCPVCKSGRLSAGGNGFDCASPECGHRFACVDDVPVLLNEANSLFRLADYQSRKKTTMDLQEAERARSSLKLRIKRLLTGLIPDKTQDVTQYTVDHYIRDVLAAQPEARILVIGAGEVDFLAGNHRNLFYTDVAIGPVTDAVADGHDLPFQDASIDAAICVAVLEHVVSPERVVAEISRVLKDEGRVYASTPFMQQVHLGQYDFTRFTALGHRMLFRGFDELESGVANGPGTALAWSIEYFLTSFTSSPALRSRLVDLGRLFAFPWRFFDILLKNKPGSYDCASAYYFVGSKRQTPLDNREIVTGYKGTHG